MKEFDFEAWAASRELLRAPRELRQQVLSQLVELAQTPSDELEMAPAVGSRFDRNLNIALALSVILAVSTWVINLKLQESQLSALLEKGASRHSTEQTARPEDLYDYWRMIAKGDIYEVEAKTKDRADRSGHSSNCRGRFQLVQSRTA